MNGLSADRGAALKRALLLGLISALLMLASIFERDEIWNTRAYALVLIWFLGGLTGGLLAMIVVRISKRLLGERSANLLRMVVFLPAFIVAGAIFFALQMRLETNFELHPDRPMASLIFGTPQHMALFLYSVSHYMLPWMAPVMMFAGFALLPRPSGG